MGSCCATTCYDVGVMFDFVYAKMSATAIFETYFHHKDTRIWIVDTGYYHTHFFLT